MVPPTTKKELQQLIGKINFVRRFISNLSGRIEPFMELVKIKANDEFRWGAEQQQAFEQIKEYLSKPPVCNILKILPRNHALRISFSRTIPPKP
jgi:hypothetical protein